jgi:hypothetical protein
MLAGCNPAIDPGLRPPTSLTVLSGELTLTGIQQILSWVDNSFNEVGFRIERQSSPVPGAFPDPDIHSPVFTHVADVAADVTAFTDVAPLNAVVTYRVAAIATSGSLSGWSNLASVANPTGDTLDDGLVAYYQFEGNANDSSGAGNNGSVHNATFVPGKFGQGLEFTGQESSNVEVPHSASLETPEAVSISLWAKVYSNRTSHSALVYKAGETPTSSGFRDRVFTLWAMSGGGVHLTSTPEGASSQTWCNASDGSYRHSEFVHFAAVIDSASHTMRTYVNGVKVAECTYPGEGIRGGEYPMRIGGYFSTLSDQSGLTGVLDDVRIYNRALSNYEIALLFDQG